ncbi:MAG: HigA family addiction module antidote protein [bacterium]|nr:HigA family addiction module antidote protein [bacterium]
MMHNPPHPGEILKEDYLDPLGLSISDACRGLDIARKGLSEIVNGHSGISPVMAVKLARAFDTTPEFWLNLQTQYDLWKAREAVSLEGVAVYCRSAQPTISA